MIILCDIILISIITIHFWKHLKYKVKCKICCGKNQSSSSSSLFCEEEFGAYPIVFFVYGIFQLLFSIFITFIYIYYIEYNDNQTWNQSNLIPTILLYPINDNQKQYTFTFIKPQPLTLTNNPTNFILNYDYSTNILFIFDLFVLVLIYIIESFIHWYRFYTVYVAQKYLKNFSFTTIMKYYLIYVLIFISIIFITIFIQNYFPILIIICHSCFNIYCSNQQIKILFKATNESFDEEHVKILMAPLYPTRNYSILSTISSTLFLFILIVSNTQNSMIYYPIFSCLSTYFLSLIFVRNRYLMCKYCNNNKEKEQEIDEVTYTSDPKHTKTGRGNPCCPYINKKHNTPQTHDEQNKIGIEINSFPQKLKLKSASSGDPDTDNYQHTDNDNGNKENINDTKEFHYKPLQKDVTIDLSQQQQLPNNMKSSPKSKHVSSELPQELQFVSPSTVIENVEMDDNIQQKQENKHHMSPTDNISLDPSDIYNKLFPSFGNTHSNTKTMTMTMTMTQTRTKTGQQEENTVIINSNLNVSSPPSVNGGVDIDVDLYDNETNIDNDINKPSSPKNTPTKFSNNNKTLILLPTNSNNAFDNNNFNHVIAKLNGTIPPALPVNKYRKDKQYFGKTSCMIKNEGEVTNDKTYIQEQYQSLSEIQSIKDIQDLKVNVDIDDDELTETQIIVEDDDDLFDYRNVQSPEEIMSRYSTKQQQKQQHGNIVPKHTAGVSSTGHENTLSIISMTSNGTDLTHSRVPSQRPTTEKNIKKFWVNNDIEGEGDNDNKNGLRNIDEINELKLESSIKSQTSSQHLDFSDLEQHLNLLQILKSQGLMKNPIDLLHSHQKLKKKDWERSHSKLKTGDIKKDKSISKQDKLRKYRDHRNKRNVQKSMSSFKE